MPTESELASQFAVAAVMRELEEFDRIDEHVAVARRRNRTGPSSVFSVRLSREEVEAIEQRAMLVGIRPSMLARNLIRAGLSGARNAEVSSALGRVEDAVVELRSLVG